MLETRVSHEKRPFPRQKILARKITRFPARPQIPLGNRSSDPLQSGLAARKSSGKIFPSKAEFLRQHSTDSPARPPGVLSGPSLAQRFSPELSSALLARAAAALFSCKRSLALSQVLSQRPCDKKHRRHAQQAPLAVKVPAAHPQKYSPHEFSQLEPRPSPERASLESTHFSYQE